MSIFGAGLIIGGVLVCSGLADILTHALKRRGRL